VNATAGGSGARVIELEAAKRLAALPRRRRAWLGEASAEPVRRRCSENLHDSVVTTARAAGRVSLLSPELPV
jgi:hypothetical protein